MCPPQVYEAARDVVDRARASTRRSQTGRSTVTLSNTWKGFVNSDSGPAPAAGVTVTEENLSVVLKPDGYQLHVDAREKLLTRQASHRAAATAGAGGAASAAPAAGEDAGGAASATLVAAPGGGTATPAAGNGATTSQPGSPGLATGQGQSLSRQASAASTRGAELIATQLGKTVEGLLASRQGQGLGTQSGMVPVRQRAQSAQPSRSRQLPAGFTGSLARPPAAGVKGEGLATMRGGAGMSATWGGHQAAAGTAPAATWGGGPAQGIAASERLGRVGCAAMAPTRKTMARCRSGRLFGQTSKHAELFSAQTPSVVELAAAAVAKRREDLQYRVLEFRAWQVHSGDTVYVAPPAAAATAGPADSQSAVSGHGAASPRARPDSAPAGGSLSVTAPAPARPFSALPASLMHSGSLAATRPLSALSTASTFSTARSSRPGSAAASTAAKRLRPPSAGAWAGRPASAVSQLPWERDMASLSEEGWNGSTQSDAVTMLTPAGVTLQMPGTQR